MTTEQKRGKAPKALTQGEAKRSPVKEKTPTPPSSERAKSVLAKERKVMRGIRR